MQIIKLALEKDNVLFLPFDEITSIDNQSWWLSIHAYLELDKGPHVVFFGTSIACSNVTNITMVISMHSSVGTYNYCCHHTNKTQHENTLNGTPCPNTKWLFTYNENKNPSPIFLYNKNAKTNIMHKTQKTCI
jgi:hypothetical protein